MPSMPRRMIATWTTQKTPKAIALCPLTSAQPEVSVVISVSSASAPIQVWMPNQPHATSARAIAATFAPRMPKLERTSTGNGIPYLVPGCEFSRIGIRTSRLPSATVSSPCHQVMPAVIRPDASVYVVITIDSPTHSAARLYVPQVRCSGPVGVRSLFDSCESAMVLVLISCAPLRRRPVERAPRELVQRVDRSLEVRVRRVLLLRVADAADRPDEQHHGRNPARHLGGVVQRPARQPRARAGNLCDRGVRQLDQLGVERDRLDLPDSLPGDRAALPLGDLLGPCACGGKHVVEHLGVERTLVERD